MTTREQALARALLRLSGDDLLRFVRSIAPNAAADGRWYLAVRLIEYAKQLQSPEEAQ